MVLNPARPSADRRLAPYALLVVTGLLAALITGEAALAAAAAPVAVLVVVALADRRALHVSVVSVSAPSRLVEGDSWVLELELRWSGDAELDILHTGMRGSEIEGVGGWTIDARDHARLELVSVACQWGRHELGSIEIRARRPRGMLRWDQTIHVDGAVRILPEASRLDELLHPRRPRVAAGSHVAPVRGPGTDFADLRPYVPGDRLRDLSWTASARGDQPWVVVHHPERTGTVVLLLDGFVEVGAPAGTLDRAARVVWSIARHHLENGDRVGLLTTGGTPVWLAPVAGRRARWQVLDTLLLAGSAVAGSPVGVRGRARPVSPRREVNLPADAIVVGVSPLQSDGFMAAIGHHARLGRPTMVIGVRTDDLLAPTTNEVERAARRLWVLDVDVRRANLARSGVPSIVVTDNAANAVRYLSSRLRGRGRGNRGQGNRGRAA